MLIDSLLSGQEGAFGSTVVHLILPTIVLGTIPLATFARMTRSSMLEVLGEDYVRTARAKGLSSFRVVGLHALRNALIPVVTVVGLQIGSLLAGAVLTEYIFSWPGVGSWLIESINRRDYPVLQGGILLISLRRDRAQYGCRPALRRPQPEDTPCPLIRSARSYCPRRARRCRVRSGASSAIFLPTGRRSSASSSLRVLVLTRFSPISSRPIRRSSSIANSYACRRSGIRAARRASCSAPTSSAATFSRASSSAPVSRCSSACRWSWRRWLSAPFSDSSRRSIAASSRSLSSG